MAKRKKENKVTSFGDAIGFNNIFQNEKVNFTIGVISFVVAIYLILSFISFFTTGAADQGLIAEPRPGEIMNAKREFQNSCGSLGAYASYFFVKQCFGLPAFLIPIFLILASMKMMRVYTINLSKWFICTMIVMVWASVTFSKFLTPLFIESWFNPGGDHGIYVCRWIENLVGSPGLIAILCLIAIIFLTYITAETIYVIRKMLNPVKFFTDRVKFEVTNKDGKNNDGLASDDDTAIKTLEDPEVFDNPETQIVEFDTTEDETDGDDSPATEKETKPKPSVKETPEPKEPGMDISVAHSEEKASGKSLASNQGEVTAPYDPKLDLENKHKPTHDIIKKYDNDGKPYIDMVEQTANKNRIVEVLRNFGVEISSIKATVGPTITLYEITPAQGVRISKIRNLEDDIALSLSALGIRIIAPIPGKGTIGIEVPNAKPNIVSMESILNSKKFQESTMELPCAVGKTITNEVFMFDLAKIPHLL
ncbi:MAG: DNA translocase FtsK 4TM domain-containing protein, partial [Prevotella sp.]|nr:DNA translocase FtsK 4TM domain-containing protein [Prevotella sp.]